MLNPRVVIQTMIALASASLGLVAALAWNEAIKETIKQFICTGDSLAGLYTYAIIATVIAVVVLLLARAASRASAATRPSAARQRADTKAMSDEKRRSLTHHLS